MKEINDQLYGYSYELDQTTEEDLTTCYAVDTGTIFIAYKGVWYEQPSFWAAQLSTSASDEYGYSYELGRSVADADLQIFNALDTGDRYVSFNGRWYKQPIAWSAPASGGGGGGGGSGVLVVHMTIDSATAIGTLDKTWQEIYDATQNGPVFIMGPSESDPDVMVFNGWLSDVNDINSFNVKFTGVFVNNASVTGMTLNLSTNAQDGYPSGSLDGQ